MVFSTHFLLFCACFFQLSFVAEKTELETLKMLNTRFIEEVVRLNVENEVLKLQLAAGKTRETTGISSPFAFKKRSLANMNNSGKLICPICKAHFKRKHGLSRHMFVHEPVPLFRCNFCSKKYFKANSRYIHVKNSHGK